MAVTNNGRYVYVSTVGNGSSSCTVRDVFLVLSPLPYGVLQTHFICSARWPAQGRAFVTLYAPQETERTLHKGGQSVFIEHASRFSAFENSAFREYPNTLSLEGRGSVTKGVARLRFLLLAEKPRNRFNCSLYWYGTACASISQPPAKSRCSPQSVPCERVGTLQHLLVTSSTAPLAKVSPSNSPFTVDPLLSSFVLSLSTGSRSLM